jgi:hypothetical protein
MRKNIPDPQDWLSKLVNTIKQAEKLFRVQYLIAASGMKAGRCLVSLAVGSATCSLLRMVSTFFPLYFSSTRCCSSSSHAVVYQKETATASVADP